MGVALGTGAFCLADVPYGADSQGNRCFSGFGGCCLHLLWGPLDFCWLIYEYLVVIYSGEHSACLLSGIPHIDRRSQLYHVTGEHGTCSYLL